MINCPSIKINPTDLNVRLVDPVEVLEAADEVEVGAPGLAAGGARRLEVPLQQVVVRFLKERK